MHSSIPLLGRVLLSAIFVLSGIGKVTGFDSTVGHIADVGLPVPQLLGLGAIAMELGGSAMILLGWKTRWAAGAMLLYTVATALLFHNFWSAPAEMMENQFIHFMKNVSISGGFFYVLAFGAGEWSLDAKRPSQAATAQQAQGLIPHS